MAWRLQKQFAEGWFVELERSQGSRQGPGRPFRPAAKPSQPRLVPAGLALGIAEVSEAQSILHILGFNSLKSASPATK